MVVNRHTNYKNNISYKIIVAFLLLVLAVIMFIFLSQLKRSYVDDKVIKQIKNMQRGPNQFWDIGNELAVHTINDLGYMIDRNNSIITLYYGKKVIHINEAALKNAEFMQELGEIGIKVYTRENPENPKETLYKLTYWGEELEEWSLRY